MLSIWHGTADRTVDISNVESLLGQWCSLHGVGPAPTSCDILESFPRRAWCDAAGKEVIEAYSITGTGHGTPLETSGIDGFGKSGAFMLDVHIGSTLLIARFWGIAPPKPVAQLAAESLPIEDGSDQRLACVAGERPASSLCPTPGPPADASRSDSAYGAVMRALAALSIGSRMATGTVKWFNGEKGYGFIEPQGGGPDVFVHISAVEQAGMRSLNEGQKVSYEIVADKRSGKSSAGNLQAA